MASTTGTIKRLVIEKGFGFVAASDGNQYFFHQSAARDWNSLSFAKARRCPS